MPPVLIPEKGNHVGYYQALGINQPSLLVICVGNLGRSAIVSLVLAV